jgi:Domain of unknown function (DUF305)
MLDENEMQRFDLANSRDGQRIFEGMIRHHTGAIEMANKEITDGQHPGAVDLAKNIATTERSSTGSGCRGNCRPADLPARNVRPQRYIDTLPGDPHAGTAQRGQWSPLASIALSGDLSSPSQDRPLAWSATVIPRA